MVFELTEYNQNIFYHNFNEKLFRSIINGILQKSIWLPEHAMELMKLWISARCIGTWCPEVLRQLS